MFFSCRFFFTFRCRRALPYIVGIFLRFCPGRWDVFFFVIGDGIFRGYYSSVYVACLPVARSLLLCRVDHACV